MQKKQLLQKLKALKLDSGLQKMFKILCVFLIFVLTSCNVKEDIAPSYGLVFDEQKYSQVPLRAMEISRSYEETPSAVSLKKYAPIPGNQNPYGTCTAWSSTYGARTIMESIALNRTDKKQTTKNATDTSNISRICIYLSCFCPLISMR